MNWEELLPLLKPYKSVLVTGPQRSGTTIGARILAQELGYRYVDEDDFWIHSDDVAKAYIYGGSCVLQAPALCHIADVIANETGCAVVMMRRPIAEILKSEERIGWRTAYNGKNILTERLKYQQRFGVDGNNIAATKYFAWDTEQKQHCVSFDLDYESLRTHPLWKEERAEFTPRQFA